MKLVEEAITEKCFTSVIRQEGAGIFQSDKYSCIMNTM